MMSVRRKLYSLVSLKVVGSLAQNGGIISEPPDAVVASTTQKGANAPCGVTVINRKREWLAAQNSPFFLVANRAFVSLALGQLCVFIKRHAVTVSKPPVTYDLGLRIAFWMRRPSAFTAILRSEVFNAVVISLWFSRIKIILRDGPMNAHPDRPTQRNSLSLERHEPSYNGGACADGMPMPSNISRRYAALPWRYFPSESEGMVRVIFEKMSDDIRRYFHRNYMVIHASIVKGAI